MGKCTVWIIYNTVYASYVLFMTVSSVHIICNKYMLCMTRTELPLVSIHMPYGKKYLTTISIGTGIYFKKINKFPSKSMMMQVFYFKRDFILFQLQNVRNVLY